ncbi:MULTISPECIES: hypothetical protein [unclassified Methylobacterium]|uniref:hypothetical protein n=1 Tax=unclassified Methylobacterium TaxID=2615210 RepID=UPI001FEDA6AE|nr:MULTISPECIES: hypothetical protein [unclassified Methylobacterium]
MDETDGLSLWPILGIAVVAGVAAWDLAKRKGLNKRSWAATCFFFAPALIALAFAKSQQRPGDTEAFRNRWASLAAYDPEIKAAVERLAELGPAAVEQFRMAYGDVQTKEAIPLIVADIERRWAAGEGPKPEVDPFERLAELHRRGALHDADYEDQKRRLREPRRPKTRWTGWWWKAPALLLVVWFIWPRGSTGFPTCDARSTRDLVRRAIEGADDNRQVNRKLLALDEIRELSFDADKRDRLCTGTAVLNSGERAIVWRLYARGGSILVNVLGF